MLKVLKPFYLIVLTSAYLFAFAVTMPWFLIHARSALHWLPIFRRVGNYLSAQIVGDDDA